MLKKYYLNVIILLIGTILMAFGGSFFIISEMGSDALMVLNQGIANTLSIKVGYAMIISNVVAFLLIIFLDRKTIGLGTIAITFLLGPMINVIINANVLLTPNNLFLKLGFTLLGNIVGGFGIALYLYANVGLSPFEAIILRIEKVTKWRFAIIKIINDAIFFLIGMLLGGRFGIGSIITVIIFGPIIGFFLKSLKKSNILKTHL